MLRTLVIYLCLLILIEHFLYLLNVLFIKLLLICLSFECATKLLTTVFLLGKQHVLLLNGVLRIHELVLQFRVTIALTVHSACVKILILHQLVLQVDWPHLVVLAHMVK